MQQRRVVITGLGALTPIGNTVSSYWEGLSHGVSGANLITRFDREHFKTQFACELKNYDPLDHFDRKNARKMDAFTQYGMVVADEAILDAGLDMEKVDRERFGVIFGSGIGGIDVFSEEVGGFATGNGVPRFNPFFIPKMIINIVAGHISIKYGLKGPSYSSVSACATSSHCMIDAVMMIKAGYTDIVLTGGAEAAINPAGIGGFNAMKALSENNDEYQTASRPFDARRDGFVMGEGAGALIVEEYEHAKARGAKIYAELSGMGMTSDAYHLTAPDPSGDGVTRVMEIAIKDAGLTTKDIDYVNVHGTSTPLGDANEINAIRRVFGDNAEQINISSTKSMTGHLLGAAGAIEAIASILAMNHGLVPPTINFKEPDPACGDLNFTFNQAQPRQINAVLSNTFGFGGHNATVLFTRFDESS
jgi:3-oxoacyl-[acyl-carrier-protein] synthase II